MGGTVKENAHITAVVLANKEQGPRTDMVLLNAAAAIAMSPKVNSFEQALQLAQKSLFSGAAQKKLEELKVLTNKQKVKKVQGKGLAKTVKKSVKKPLKNAKKAKK